MAANPPSPPPQQPAPVQQAKALPAASQASPVEKPAVATSSAVRVADLGALYSDKLTDTAHDQ